MDYYYSCTSVLEWPTQRNTRYPGLRVPNRDLFGASKKGSWHSFEATDTRRVVTCKYLLFPTGLLYLPKALKHRMSLYQAQSLLQLPDGAKSTRCFPGTRSLLFRYKQSFHLRSLDCGEVGLAGYKSYCGRSNAEGDLLPRLWPSLRSRLDGDHQAKRNSTQHPGEGAPWPRNQEDHPRLSLMSSKHHYGHTTAEESRRAKESEV
jgi:hypothetical protein